MFRDEFVNAYQADLTSMLDLADELPLVHTPAVSVEGNLQTHDLDVFIDGHALADYDLESIDGVEAHGSTYKALLYMHTLGACATMHLLASESATALPAGSMELTDAQKQLLDDIVSKAQNEFKGARYSYALYQFNDNETGNAVDVACSRAISALGAISIRELRLSVSDAYVQKELIIGEMPESFDGTISLDVQQYIKPVEDVITKEMIQFFEDNNLPDAMGAIMKLYFAKLIGKDDIPAGEAELVTSFSAIDKSDELKKILHTVTEKAEAAKRNTAFNLGNPEMVLPSAEDLHEYQTLLSEMRS